MNGKKNQDNWVSILYVVYLFLAILGAIIFSIAMIIMTVLNLNLKSTYADINEGKIVDKAVEACFNDTVNYFLIVNVKYEQDGKEKSNLKSIKVSEDTYFEVNVGDYMDDLSALESQEV